MFKLLAFQTRQGLIKESDPNTSETEDTIRRYCKAFLSVLFCLYNLSFVQAQIQIKDQQTHEPVSFATIAFGNGQGVFANDEGQFYFSERLYPGVDSLTISSVGYKTTQLSIVNLPKIIFLEIEFDALDEIVIHSKIERKYKESYQKPHLDDDYFHCWLPTIDAELAVYFPNADAQKKGIKTVHFPFTLESVDWKKRKRANAEKKPFSTLFKVTVYANSDGIPGKALHMNPITFRVTEKDGPTFDLDLSKEHLLVPENGFFVSLQPLGYTDDNGKLLPNKMYKEIGDVKIPTNFRPLLPFTDQNKESHTFIKRIFMHDNKWMRFEAGEDSQSSLLQAGKTNYGMGITLKIYKDE